MGKGKSIEFIIDNIMCVVNIVSVVLAFVCFFTWHDKLAILFCILALIDIRRIKKLVSKIIKKPKTESYYE